MDDVYIDLGVSILLRVLKDTKKAQKFRRAMLKVFKAIAAAYARDAEFTEVVQQKES